MDAGQWHSHRCGELRVTCRLPYAPAPERYLRRAVSDTSAARVSQTDNTAGGAMARVRTWEGRRRGRGHAAQAGNTGRGRLGLCVGRDSGSFARPRPAARPLSSASSPLYNQRSVGRGGPTSVVRQPVCPRAPTPELCPRRRTGLYPRRTLSTVRRPSIHRPAHNPRHPV